jgi:AraC-like DNA-binding protein
VALYQTYSFQAMGPGASTEELTLPVRIVGTGWERRNESSYRWDNNRHGRKPFHVLQYTTAGHGVFRRRSPHGGEQVRDLGPGDLLVASWEIEYEYRVVGGGVPWEFRWVILEGPWADQVMERVRRSSPVLPLDLASAPVALMENLHRRLELRDVWDRFALSTVGYELCVSLLKETEASGMSARREVEREAEAWVLAHLGDADCPTMAARFGYNGKYFVDYFRRHTGMTPQRFIMDRKMRYATILLTCTARTVGSISADLGFAEDNYFSRVFRQHTGQSPQKYRQTHRDSLVYDVLVPL